MAKGRRVLAVVVRGVLLGSLLAMAAPEKPLSAGACTCSDDGSANYKCDGQSRCKAGGEHCLVLCS